ncbi:hypothetical protein [Streptomyces sp. NPDC051310]
MTLDAVTAFYQQQMESQSHQDALHARRPEYDRITVESILDPGCLVRRS